MTLEARKQLNERLDYLRGEIEAERISMGELIELQGYGEERVIPEGDIVLLEWAGVPEFSGYEEAEL